MAGGGSGGGGGMDAANLLKPMLARGKLKVIGATTLNEYREYIEKGEYFQDCKVARLTVRLCFRETFRSGTGRRAYGS